MQKEKLSGKHGIFCVGFLEAKRARKGESNWWKLSEHRAWQRAQIPKLVSTFFGKAGYFAWDNTGDFVVVQGHRWKPKSPKHEEDFYERVGLAYLAIICSSLIDDLLSYVSNSLGGGQWDLSQKYIQNMPLPNLFNEPHPRAKATGFRGLNMPDIDLRPSRNMLNGASASLRAGLHPQASKPWGFRPRFYKAIDQEALGNLVQIGNSINQGQGYDKDALNQLTLHLYGLPENTLLV